MLNTNDLRLYGIKYSDVIKKCSPISNEGILKSTSTSGQCGPESLVLDTFRHETREKDWIKVYTDVT